MKKGATMSKWSRRRVLASLGLGGAALPLLPLLSSSSKAAAGCPKRLIIFMLPGGSVAENFFPAGSGASLGTLPSILSPLERHRDDLVVVEGLSNQTLERPRTGHIGAMGSILTGRPILETGFVESGDNYMYDYGFASGPSIDQVIAQRYADEVPFPSLEAGLYVDRFGSNKGRTQWRMSYSGSNRPVHPENDPSVLFDRVFGGAMGDTSAREERGRRRRSVLDYLSGEVGSLRAQVPLADREKLDQHLEGLSELERNLAADTIVCDSGALDGSGAPENRPRIVRQHMEVLVKAMACDLTRVGSIQIAGEGRGIGPLGWLGQSDDDHVYQHDWNVGGLTQTREFWAGEIAHLVDLLKAVPEGDGTLFDSTMILWTSGIAKGDSHDSDNLPFAILGSAGGAFASGRVVRASGLAHNHLLTSICHAMGLDDIDTFGSDAYGTGPLPGLA